MPLGFELSKSARFTIEAIFLKRTISTLQGPVEKQNGSLDPDTLVEDFEVTTKK